MGNTILLVMKKTKIWVLALGLILAMPFVLFAEEQEVEIELIEVVGGGFLPGDDPLDGSGHIGANPTDPNQFHATITGRTLAVTSANANATQVIVRNAAGNVVVNTQFYGYTSQQLSASGAHSIEIHNGGLTLVGNFQAQ